MPPPLSHIPRQLQGHFGAGGAVLFGIALAVFAFAVLSLVDALIKTLSTSYSVFQLTAMRGLIACSFMLAILAWRQELADLRTKHLKLQLARGVLSFVAATCFFFALSRMPIADLYVIAFTAPFMVAALSWPLLRERVVGTTWFAIAIGFVGVLITFQPSGVIFGFPVLVGLGAALAYATSNIVMRRLGPYENPIVTTIFGMGGGGLLGLLAAIPFWVTPSAADLALMAAAGLLAGLGALGLSASFRFAPAAIIAPVDYSSMIWGVLYGYLFFGDVPGIPTLIGATVIVAAGLWLVRQQHKSQLP